MLSFPPIYFILNNKVLNKSKVTNSSATDLSLVTVRQGREGSVGITLGSEYFVCLTVWFVWGVYATLRVPA